MLARPSGHPAVLVVDDDGPTRDALSDLLDDEGYVVYLAPDGHAALHRLCDHLEGMIVLLDLNMPGMDGAQLLHRVITEPPWLSATPFSC